MRERKINEATRVFVFDARLRVSVNVTKPGKFWVSDYDKQRFHTLPEMKRWLLQIESTMLSGLPSGQRAPDTRVRTPVVITGMGTEVDQVHDDPDDPWRKTFTNKELVRFRKSHSLGGSATFLLGISEMREREEGAAEAARLLKKYHDDEAKKARR